MSGLLDTSGNNQHLQQLLADVSIRASAHRRWPALGFYDRAAELLLSRLGEPPEPVAADCRHERMALLRSRWFDSVCQRFFTEHPEGMCIDLQAGLSTRFHRICATADWPRFCWVDVDSPEVVALKSRLFPTTENYRFLAGEATALDWLEGSRWQPGTPLLVVLANPLTPLSKRHFLCLLRYLADAGTRHQPVSLAFSYIKAGPVELLQKRFLQKLPWLNRRQPHTLVFTKPEQLLQACSGYQLVSECTFRVQRTGLHRLTHPPIHNACACIKRVVW